jgi:hypothetical protein
LLCSALAKAILTTSERYFSPVMEANLKLLRLRV